MVDNKTHKKKKGKRSTKPKTTGNFPLGCFLENKNRNISERKNKNIAGISTGNYKINFSQRLNVF